MWLKVQVLQKITTYEKDTKMHLTALFNVWKKDLIRICIICMIDNLQQVLILASKKIMNKNWKKSYNLITMKKVMVSLKTALEHNLGYFLLIFPKRWYKYWKNYWARYVNALKFKKNEVGKILELILVLPATNATLWERSWSYLAWILGNSWQRGCAI